MTETIFTSTKMSIPEKFADTLLYTAPYAILAGHGVSPKISVHTGDLVLEAGNRQASQWLHSDCFKEKKLSDFFTRREKRQILSVCRQVQETGAPLTVYFTPSKKTKHRKTILTCHRQEQVFVLTFHEIETESPGEKGERDVWEKIKKEKDKTLDLLKRKQEYLSHMSHEIRTQLTAILGFTEEVLKLRMEPDQRKCIDAIKTSGGYLLHLVNDILDLARVNEGKIDFEEAPFSVRECMQNALFAFTPKIKEKGLMLKTTYDPALPSVLLGDAARLNQILLNLINNAIKFTDRGEIGLAAKILKEDADRALVKFSVSDTGIGIESKNLGHIFESYRQADKSIYRHYGGSGLGLSIVKELAEGQGGHVGVNSKPGLGSTFYVTLPFKKSEATILPAASFDVRYRNRPELVRILIVEDDVLNQLLLKTMFSHVGFTFDVADNGRIALEFLQKNTYDIILMDLRMPVMGGFEAADIIRNRLGLQTPIIALTADITDTDIRRIRESGMNAHLGKPLNRDTLYNLISRYCPHVDI